MCATLQSQLDKCSGDVEAPLRILLRLLLTADEDTEMLPTPGPVITDTVIESSVFMDRDGACKAPASAVMSGGMHRDHTVWSRDITVSLPAPPASECVVGEPRAASTPATVAPEDAAAADDPEAPAASAASTPDPQQTAPDPPPSEPPADAAHASLGPVTEAEGAPPLSLQELENAAGPRPPRFRMQREDKLFRYGDYYLVCKTHFYIQALYRASLPGIVSEFCDEGQVCSSHRVPQTGQRSA